MIMGTIIIPTTSIPTIATTIISMLTADAISDMPSVVVSTSAVYSPMRAERVSGVAHHGRDMCVVVLDRDQRDAGLAGGLTPVAGRPVVRVPIDDDRLLDRQSLGAHRRGHRIRHVVGANAPGHEDAEQRRQADVKNRRFHRSF